MKILLGVGTSMSGRLLVVDALGMHFREVEITRDPTCPACGTREITALADYEQFCGTAPSDDGEVRPMGPRELATRLQRGDALQLIDVREPWEHHLAHVPQSVLIPLGALPNEYAARIDPKLPVALLCHHGARSYAAAEFLLRQGYREVYNVEGGIDRYSREVDPALARY